MTQEEKAKRYDEAISMAEKFYTPDSNNVNLKATLEMIFPELKESEDEKIRKAIHIYLDWLDGKKDYAPRGEYTIRDMIAWLEKQGEHANFRNKIQIGDKVTRNEDGVLVNLSQLNRVAKKQGEQETLCDKCKKEQPSHSCQDITELGRCAVEYERNHTKFKPKFHEGDWVILTAGELSTTLQIVKVDTNKKLYWFNDSSYLPIADEECLRLWSIQDAKDGDVLACPNDAGDRDVVFIFKNINSDEGWVFCYCAIDANGCFCTNNDYVGNSNSTNISPATKEQRDTLMKAMADAGYEFDFEKKELKKIGQKHAESRQETKPNGGIVYEGFNEGKHSSYIEILDFIDSLQEEPAHGDLEEASEKFRWNIEESCYQNDNGTYAYSSDNIEEAFKAGAKWQKEQMMAKAIDAHCFGFQGAALFSFKLPADKYLVGSEVKVIVIKED